MAKATTKVHIKALLYPPGFQIGGTVLPIFEGNFIVRIPAISALPRYMQEIQSVRVGGVDVGINKRSRKKGVNHWTCSTKLRCVSKRYFRKLKKLGWELQKEGAKHHGLPSNKQNKDLRKYLKESREQVRTTVELLKNIDKSHNELCRQISAGLKRGKSQGNLLNGHTSAKTQPAVSLRDLLQERFGPKNGHKPVVRNPAKIKTARSSRT